jgi:hypothetical protein
MAAVLDGLITATSAIRDALQPHNLTLPLLVDPRDASHAPYMLSLDIVQGVLFGLGFLTLLVAILFMILRGLYGLCGGREPNKLGYAVFNVWAVRLGYYGVSALSMCALWI